MARVIYAVLIVALGTLVAGFVIRDSSIPLLISTALSAVVFVLILGGWSRRIRRGEGFMAPLEEEPAMEELEIVEVDEAEVFAPPPAARRKAAATTTIAMPEIDVETEDEEEVPPPKPKVAARKKAPAKKPAAKRKPAADRAHVPRVLVIPGRERYHAPGCRFARGDNAREVSELTAKRRGYVPCSVCQPASAPESEATSGDV